MFPAFALIIVCLSQRNDLPLVDSTRATRQFAPTSAPEFSSEKDSAMHIATIIGKPKTGDADVNVRKALRFQERAERLSAGNGGGRGGAGGRGRGGARGGGGGGRGRGKR